jgi:hypothetical protein
MENKRNIQFYLFLKTKSNEDKNTDNTDVRMI